MEGNLSFFSPCTINRETRGSYPWWFDPTLPTILMEMTMATKKKKPVKKTTSKDVPGKGLAKKAATAIEKRKKMLKSI